MENTAVKLMSKIFARWTLSDIVSDNQNPHFPEEMIPHVAKIVRARMSWVGSRIMRDPTFIKMDDAGYLVIDLMSGSNPGIALAMQHHMLNELAKQKGGKLTAPVTITSFDFANIFPVFYQCGESKEHEDMWIKIWDEQKTEDGKNKVDDIRYWMELFDIKGMRYEGISDIK